MFSTILDYYVGKEIWKTKKKVRKKILLIISLVGNLGLLGFFKYTDFAFTQFNILGNYINLTDEIPLLNIVLPIGISFYTFQTLSYTIDIYRGHLKPSKTFQEFALFVTFFPQLVAGPIVRAKDFLPQLREKMDDFQNSGKIRLINITDSNLKLGITMMAIGFLKKMFFADNIAPIANDIFANSITATSSEIWLGTIAFAFQIYGDFSGYSDIAIGAALILGFKIPMNFNKPYFATSPPDFWRRWHISLSTWVRDYLFFPIVFRKLNSDLTFMFGTMITFFIIGLWHGAGWNFIIWGIIHGVYVSAYYIIRKKVPYLSNNSFFKSRTGKIISILGTQYLIFFSYIAFRVNDVNDMHYLMYKFIVFDFQFLDIIQFVILHKIPVVILGLFITLNFISFRKANLVEKISKLDLKIWFIVLLLISLSIGLFYNGNSGDFIYFRF